MPGAFMLRNLVTPQVGITSPQATVGALPLSNLNDPQPRTRARFVGISGASGFFVGVTIDLLAQQSLDCVAVIGTTFNQDMTSALYRIRFSATDPTAFAADAWDSGFGFVSTSREANGNLVVVRPDGPVTGRYLLVEMGGHTGENIDIGRIAAGELWRLSRAHAYGIEEGRLIYDRRDRNPLTGAEFAVPSVFNPRIARFRLPVMTPAEAIDQHRALVDTLGAADDGLWIPDLALSQAETNRRSIWGGMALPGEAATAAHTSHPTFARAFTLTERA